MKTKVRTAIGIATAIITLAFASASFGQPVPPDPGGTNDPPTPEELEAMWQAYLAQLETNRQSILPTLHQPLVLPDGSPWTVDSAASYQTDQLLLLAEENHWANESAFLSVSNWSQSTGEPMQFRLEDDPDGRTARVLGFAYDEPIIIAPDDVFGADTISVDELWPGGATGFGLTGTNTPLGLWDEGAVRRTHLELGTNRVTQVDGATVLSRHSTGVAGVLAAAGAADLTIGGNVVTQAAKGMSFQAPIFANDFGDDTGEMPDVVATNDLRLSNHSYGPQTGWFYFAQSNVWRWAGITNLSQNEDYKFGFYHPQTAARDQIAVNAPNYLPVWTPGNNRGEAPPIQPTNHQVLVGLVWTNAPLIARNADGDAGGYDTIHYLGAAKNVLTVGACFPIAGGYSGTQSVVLPSFSPFGPTDDGRIKPDVVAPGVTNVMPSSTGDFNYYLDSGTSFAAPGVTGGLNLLMQLHSQVQTNARPWLGSTLKLLAIHTADEAGPNAGPDYQHGWGLFNAQTAAELVQANATNGWKAHIKEMVLPEGGVAEFPVVSGGTQPLKVTICWTDTPGTAPQFASIDPTNAMLVNDLDLRVIAPNGTTNFPWILNPDLVNKSAATRASAATTGDDNRNNVEQVFIASPASGTYTVRVTHKGSLHGGTPQAFSWAASGNTPQAKPGLLFTQIIQTATNKVALAWDAVPGQNYLLQYRDNVASGTWSDAAGEVNGIKPTVSVEVPFSFTNAHRFYRIQEVE